jgi:hypothetical protein
MYCMHALLVYSSRSRSRWHRWHLQIDSIHRAEAKAGEADEGIG